MTLEEEIKALNINKNTEDKILQKLTEREQYFIDKMNGYAGELYESENLVAAYRKVLKDLMTLGMKYEEEE